MDGNLDISIDKLPIKRLEVIEENGVERFPSDVGHEEKRVDLIRRIDFAWAVEREEPSSKKQKKTTTSKETHSSGNQPWQWQSLVENLQLAHQELSVIIDLINTLEANNDVTVASMTRPKQLPNELLSDLAVSTATKLQCFRHLGRYFKQSAKALEQQVAREARFYGALIRLQQNWKVKRHRAVAAASGNEGFYIDLFDNSLNDPAAAFRPSSVSTVRVEHDSAGMLAVNLPPNSCRTLQFEFLGAHSSYNARRSSRTKVQTFSADGYEETKKEHLNDDKCVRETHALLREVHLAIFNEQVFELVNREVFNPSIGVNVTGIQENYLRLSIGQGASVSVSLVPSGQDDQTVSITGTNNLETAIISMESFEEGRRNFKKSAFANQISFEIYLQQLFHEHVFVKAKRRAASSSRSQVPGQPAKDSFNLLGHFCLSLAHRIFSIRVLTELENLVASQVISWLHGEALTVGIKANRDFLSLSFELDQGELLSLVSHIDPEDAEGCISWWLVMEDGFTEEHKLRMDISSSESETRKFLGHLSLDVLYSTVFDLVGLCGGGGMH
ncbi:mediator of RNA polymerase II transcription subunit 17 isoform X2 [Coffea eugenioides]|uniref:mediator of RNA polymerase II transcription subunit 17 isoform X2 n=1 Tax=Coffea eugenioides TaxID=49369 RepID=UPI000F60B67B|nr:mediator of RNA polymerase II transcription subunit 17 isoform X2 [Coffea eugenioides]